MVLLSLQEASADAETSSEAPLLERVASLRQSIADEQAAALNVAMHMLHPPDRSKALSREQLRSVTSLPTCAHGLLAAASEPPWIVGSRLNAAAIWPSARQQKCAGPCAYTGHAVGGSAAHAPGAGRGLAQRFTLAFPQGTELQ